MKSVSRRLRRPIPRKVLEDLVNAINDSGGHYNRQIDKAKTRAEAILKKS
jgi:hypothetical protein